MSDTIGDMLTVWDKAAGYNRCLARCLAHLETMMALYLGDETAPGAFAPNADRDRAITVISLNGDPYTILASQVQSWKLSTRESRAQQRRLDAAFDAEVAEDTQRFAPPKVETEPAAEAANG